MKPFRVLMLAAGVLLLGTSGSAFANLAQVTATPSAPPHPIAGSWDMRPVSPNLPFSGVILVVFTAEGAFMQSHAVPEDGPPSMSPLGVGAWSATGERTLDLTYWVMIDAAGEHYMAWARIEVSGDGRTFFGSLYIEVMAPDGSVRDGQRTTVMGIRLDVEPFPAGALPPVATPATIARRDSP